MKASVVTTAVLVASMAGCASSTAGQPTASDGASPETEETSESSSPPSSDPKKEPDFTNTALCELLTPEEATSLGGSETGEAGYSTNGGAPFCQWSNETSLVLGFQKDGQSGQLPSGPEITNTDITVAGVPATLSKRVTSVFTNCQVLVNVGKSATISTLAGLHDSGKGKYEECDLATKFANIVLPKVLEN